MHLNLSICLENAAFDGDPGPELARILRGLATACKDGIPRPGIDQSIRDVNGNTCGRAWTAEGSTEEALRTAQLGLVRLRRGDRSGDAFSGVDWTWWDARPAIAALRTAGWTDDRIAVAFAESGGAPAWIRQMLDGIAPE